MNVPKKTEDLTGRVINNFEILEYAGRSQDIHGFNLWRVRCTCGKESVIFSSVLSKKTGTKYCVHCKEQANTKHGMWKSVEFSAWNHMLSRCTNVKHPQYKLYGGRGIKVCDRWLNSFANFLQDMGYRPGPHFSLDRIDVNAGYYKENCRWATDKEQNNNKTNTKYLTLDGITLPITQWSEKLGINIATLWSRVNRGLSDKEVLSTAVRGK